MKNLIKKLKWWHWLLMAVALGCLVAGIGFIPITETVEYACIKTEEYTCTKVEEYTCTKVREVPCTVSETYTYTVEVPYTTTEQEELTYTTWSADAAESWWDCDIWIDINVRNTDTVGGYFTVNFQCYYNGYWHTQYVTKYLAPDNGEEFKTEFVRSCDGSWSWRTPVVTPPTKTVTVTNYRTETRTGVREVQSTCPEPYETTCTREVGDICTREYQDTCYRYETNWLFWR